MIIKYDLVVDSLSSKSFSQYLIKILNEQLPSPEFILKDSTLLQLTSDLEPDFKKINTTYVILFQIFTIVSISF